MLPTGTPLATSALHHSDECNLTTAAHAPEDHHKHHHLLKAFCTHKDHHADAKPCEDNSLAHTTSQHGHGHHVASHPSHPPYNHHASHTESSSDALLAKQIAEQKRLNQREADLATVGEIRGLEDRHLIPGRGQGAEGGLSGHEERNILAGNLRQDPGIGGGRSTIEERVPSSTAPKFV